MKKISFITEDNIKLDGLLYKSEIVSNGVVISIHGMTSNCFKRRDDIFANEYIKNNISYFCFNNRGHDLTAFVDKYIDNKRTGVILGTSFEDALDSYYDITGAIKAMTDIGYEKIHLQGHSMGSIKIVYAYNKLKIENNTSVLNKISSVILLSLIDIVGIQKYSLKDKFDSILEYALEKEKDNKSNELMPKNAFLHPMSVKSYLRYFKHNEKIDFVKFSDENYDFEEFNNITVPIFMRWGNDNEMILQDVNKLVKLMNSKINNIHKNIGYIDGANHNYDEKELVLANEIISFLKTYN